MSFQPQRVLIAEADAELGRRLFKALLDLDVLSDLSADRDDALQKLGSRSYVMVLLDVSDPIMDPARLLHGIAHMPREQQPIVVAIGTSGAARNLESELIHIVVRKPIAVAQLAEPDPEMYSGYGPAKGSTARKSVPIRSGGTETD